MPLPRRDFLRALALATLVGGASPLLAAEPRTRPLPDLGTDPLPEVLAPYVQLTQSAMGTWVCVPARLAREVVVEGWDPDRGRVFMRNPAEARPIRGTPWTLWHAPVAPNLPYRILVDGQPHGGLRRIRRPADGATARVAFLNDLHDRVGTLALAAARLTPDNHDLTVLLGDIFNDPSGKDGAERTFRTLHALATLLRADEVPMLYLPGNHDYRGAFADRVDDLFLAPRIHPSAHDPNGAVGAADQGWDFRLGPLALVAADTGEDFDKRPELFRPLRERQVPALREALHRAGDAAWRVFLSHIPLFSDDIWNSEHARETWTPSLSQGKVDLALAGHVHAWKIIPAGKEQAIRFTASPKDVQPIDREVRYTPPFPTVIGGGPEAERATVMLLEAGARTLSVRVLAAADGRELTRLDLVR
jgi:predicted MPP superfamily phosphohydrolase